MDYGVLNLTCSTGSNKKVVQRTVSGHLFLGLFSAILRKMFCFLKVKTTVISLSKVGQERLFHTLHAVMLPVKGHSHI